MTNSRVPAGVPTGGQFAAGQRRESRVSLVERREREVVPGEDGETLVREFCCEVHDGPGSCTLDCAVLVSRMNPESGVDFDPTGTSYGPPRPYEVYDYDEQARASICVTHVPEGETLARILQPGQRIVVDGEPRTVDSVAERRDRKVLVGFEGHDRAPDGSPEAYFTRTFRADEVFTVAD